MFGIMSDKEPFLSTPSARRATVVAGVPHIACFISIHALREEGDRSPNTNNNNNV